MEPGRTEGVCRCCGLWMIVDRGGGKLVLRHEEPECADFQAMVAEVKSAAPEAYLGRSLDVLLAPERGEA